MAKPNGKKGLILFKKKSTNRKLIIYNLYKLLLLI